MTVSTKPRFIPNPGIAATAPYRVERQPIPIDLFLDGNEGAGPSLDRDQWSGYFDPECLRRYPSAQRLECRIAEKQNLDPARVLVTAGGDEAIDRFCRIALAPGRSMVLPVPTFAMFPHYARLQGATVNPVPWPEGPFPTDEVLSQTDNITSAIVVVSPNNPTGAVATADDVRRLAEAVPSALLMLDLAYAEFADDDLTGVGLQYPNVVLVRSLSKAWGLAGLRVGYALGNPEIIHYLRTAGGPYTVPGLSLAIAEDQMNGGEDRVRRFVTRIRQERRELFDLLTDLGAGPLPSQGNFVLAAFHDSSWVRDGLAGFGIAVRSFDGKPELSDKLRLTCPGQPEVFDRLAHALKTVLTPEALLFDLDGVLADVSGSYRTAIIETAATFGVQLTRDDISRAKAAGNANNDWELTQSLLGQRGVETALDDVTRRFEEIYQGTAQRPGLRETERLLWPAESLQRLSRRVRLGLVTGRPRADAERFLKRFKIAEYFDAVVCMEDAPAKPDPAPLHLALDRLGASRAWMIGDTPDDARAARSAAVLPIGIVAPGEDPSRTTASLYRAGAGRILTNLDELEGLLP